MTVNPKLRQLASRCGGTFSREDALQSGYTPSQIRERLRAGRWTAVRRGFYAAKPEWADKPPWERSVIAHKLAVHATSRALAGSGVVISHQSAAILHGLTGWGLDLGHVHVTRRDKSRGRLLGGTRHHVGELFRGDVTEVGGVAVTAIARAIVETACFAPYEAAVALCDDALHRSLVTKADLHTTLDRVLGWPGTGRASAVVEFADGLSESVGESRLRVLMDNHGLPTPELQTRFGTGPDVAARVDFFFREYDVVVEFDGLIKYRGDTLASVVREKAREDRLRALGVLVIRVTWDDLQHPELLIRRIREAFARSSSAKKVLSH
ncbi:type IV toxin-antitoxin system AbiEi family antitoxin domain-containing protein [Kribbella qitaiheensis]|nr:type IV toxin-antitoxin system AbiEi family antitoxin domain-containing protein [Kribbella qitaiheensis]